MTFFDPTSSVHREKVLEHVFLGEVSKRLLKATGQGPEILRAEHDSFGYDTVLEFGGVMRHVQLKIMRKGGKRTHVEIHTALAAKPGGCVVWMQVDEEYELGPFGWFGGAPGQPLPPLGDRVVRHSKADGSGYKAVRPNLRSAPKSRFVFLKSIDEVVGALFGDLHGHILRHHLRLRAAQILPPDDPALLAASAGDFRALPCQMSWDQSAPLAYLIDGHQLAGLLGNPDAAAFADAMRARAQETGVWTGSAAELWVCLSVEHRRERSVDRVPAEDGAIADLPRSLLTALDTQI